MILPLTAEITEFFSTYEEHVTQNLFIVTQGIFAAKSTNLNVVKDEIANILHNQETTQPESNYVRLVRFFRLPDEEKAKLIQSLLCLAFFLSNERKFKPKYLTLDGTSWEYGTKKIHLLVLAIVVNGVSIPIWWEDLDKKGISSQEERMALLEKACRLYKLRGLILLADREYEGEQWFNFLIKKGLGFIIRLKKGVYKSYVDDQRQENSKHHKHQRWRYRGMEQQAKQVRFKNVGVSKVIKIQGHTLTFVVFKNPKADAEEPLVYFISTVKKKKQIVEAYPIRWTIECCFKHLKSNGFELEALNFKDSEKIKLMMAMVVFLYVLCLNEGWLRYTHKKKSDWKKYQDGKVSLAASIFKKGLSYAKGKFNDLASFFKYLSKLLRGKNAPFWLLIPKGKTINLIL